MARANQITGLTNGRAANWAPKVILVLSACFPVVNWCSRSVAKSAYFVLNKAVILYFLTLYFSLFPLFLKKAADFIRYTSNWICCLIEVVSHFTSYLYFYLCSVRMNNPAGILAATWTDKILIMLIDNWTTKIRLFFLNCFQKYCIAFESLSNNSFTCKSCIFTCKLLHLTMRKIISIKPCCQTLGHGENLNLTLPVQIPHPGEGGSEVLKWSASRGEESLFLP